MIGALAEHWPEYLIEGWALGMFMISAALFVAVFEHPSSPLRNRFGSALVRRSFIGLAMGVTAIALIYSPWGQRSGAQMNPAVTLAFAHLGKVKRWDAIFYIAGQFIGGAVGLYLAKLLLRSVIAHPAVNHVATVPGKAGVAAAFVAECAIACGMMLMVLVTTNNSGTTAYTGVAAGFLVFLYITFEAPISGMSMNPARTTASALSARSWKHIWIYFLAPTLGMLLSAEVFIRTMPNSTDLACPKLYHGIHQRCIFCGHSGGDEGLLFAMALVSFTAALIVTYIHRSEIPAYEPTRLY